MNKIFLSLLLVFLGSCSFFHLRSTQLAYVDADKSARFETSDLSRVSDLFVSALKKEGFKIQYLDNVAGKVTAIIEKADGLAVFNVDFTGGSNYKLNETLVVDVVTLPESDGLRSEMKITRTEKFSMGQEVTEELKDPTLYRSLFSQVKAGLAVAR